MKQISKTLLKGLFVIVLFTTGSVVLSTATGVPTVNAASASIGYNQVYEYLASKGYTVFTLNQDPGTKFNWVAQTSINGIHYNTTIYCTSTEIVGNADVIF
ncbi:MAG: hypothetical protein JWP12_74 [Bacteroidetes bacterium]|nr:hypothetical protein [Bacteroidota bacterium]